MYVFHCLYVFVYHCNYCQYCVLWTTQHLRGEYSSIYYLTNISDTNYNDNTTDDGYDNNDNDDNSNSNNNDKSMITITILRKKITFIIVTLISKSNINHDKNYRKDNMLKKDNVDTNNDNNNNNASVAMAIAMTMTTKTTTTTTTTTTTII